MSQNRAILRGASASMLIQIANVGLTYVGTAVLTRVLSPGDFGIYSFILSLALVLAVPAQFGVPTLVVRETAAARTLGDFGLMRGLIIRANQFIVISSLVMAVGAAVVSLLSPGARGNLAILLWGLALVPLTSLSAVRGGLLRGMGKVLHGQWPDQILKTGLFLVALVPVWLMGRRIEPDLAMALNVGATLAALVAGMLLFLGMRPKELPEAKPRFETRRWLASMAPFALSTGTLLITGHTGVLMMYLLGNQTDTAVYRIAQQTSLFCGIGYTAVIAILAPRFASAHAARDRDAIRHEATLGARLATLACAPFVLILVVAGGPLLGLGFGAAYAVGWAPMAVMAGAQLVNAMFGCAASVLIMGGAEKDTTISFLVGLGAQIALAAVMIPLFGVMGGALATAGSTLLTNLLLWRYAKRRFDVDTGFWAGWGKKV